MRAPAVLTAVALLSLTAATLEAQDLQYRMTMETVMPAMPMKMPPTVMRVSLKGTALRMDIDMPRMGMAMSTIMDSPNRRMVMLRHADSVYMEMPLAKQLEKYDSIAKNEWRDFKPTVKETGETRQMAGYTVSRIVQSVDMKALPTIPGMEHPPENQKLVIVMEQWVSYEPKLVKAYEAFTSAMSRGGPDPLTLASMGMKPGLPIKLTTMMLHLPENKPYDAEAILKAGESAPGMKSKTTMTIDNIKMVTLDPSLFTVPKGYKKE